MLGVDRLPAQDLASEGIVVVSASFRLQALGFLCLGDSSARGNLGILDQYLAMLWIRENISKFGGDPQKVTLMGYGNAAISVIYHMASSRSKGTSMVSNIMIVCHFYTNIN